MNKVSQKINDSSKSSHRSIKALCNQSPFLIINTPCGVARYKFNRIGYNNKDEIVLEYKIINDDKYKSTNIYYFIPLILIAGYGPAWIGHFFIEKNKPATFKYPLWSLIGDHHMAYLMITGQLKKRMSQSTKP